MEKTIHKLKSHTELRNKSRNRAQAERHLHSGWTDERILQRASVQLLQPDSRLVADILLAARQI